jgi:hypothetical protein
MLPKIHVDINGTLADLERLRKKMPIYIERGCLKVGAYVSGKVRSDSLRGQVLNRRTNNLWRSIDHETTRSGKDLTVWIGSNVLSPKGFNYPAHWELYAKRVAPRPYIQPQIDNNRENIKNIYVKQIRKDIAADFKGAK